MIELIAIALILTVAVILKHIDENEDWTKRN
ncbi:hypothetical protein UFOVP104_12 [uncultured Caudovirales phage]|uniref:Uncharacterized protein n=1 Tax=uncultured Caudovirales phage TaxID=2100421 RepID=A0A6J5L8C3_9CAUD|nr:hypothetical protein UFOVP104_12 [uncultured Caudovirales phage]CAB4134340.1 hypothetical protein UFOVP271_47 [uncultured Caudovirales phage]